MEPYSLSKRIQEERTRANLTQEDLASRLGITKAAVSKWECGQSMPDILLLPKLASVFSVSIDDLLGYAPSASPEITASVVAEVSSLCDTDQEKAASYALESASRFWSDPSFIRSIAMTLYAKALADIGTGDTPEACISPVLAHASEKLFRRIIQLEPEGTFHDVDMQSLCMVLSALGKGDEAVSLISGQIPEKPNTSAITMAGILMRQGENLEARNILKRQLLFALLETASCIQALAGCCNISELETLVVLSEGLVTPDRFDALTPMLLPLLRYELAATFASSGDTNSAIDVLTHFRSDLDALCAILCDPQNPAFFDEVKEMLWQDQGDDNVEARRQGAITMRTSFHERFAKDDRWCPLREEPRFASFLCNAFPGDEEACK